MSYTEHQILHGFRVCSVRNGREPEGTAVRMEHIRTGAQLFWLDNSSENMVFSITFRTPPECFISWSTASCAAAGNTR